ncbi:molybdopterin synthase catalytic subunit MoaE [Paraglaciecola arctica]|uniref:Molybdopterin synthase catalytic subunit n=1 Tax=Paraglaciecola arctica BSs20135 TaxID=493475 RepID=K6YLT9_9ALTE|nr:molybdopterin synthase catalytic subunit MoaE [Paraglaciecola arctica]GAC17608.1 molybdopterin synthase catalytic subunit [Paraglaciecola arctica BSs20135]
MAHFTHISVQTQDFDFAHEYQKLRDSNSSDGALVTFVGLVRDLNLQQAVSGLFLEHYPAMTEKVLNNIVEKARTKWQLGSVSIIHRVGQLQVSEQIVFVGVTSQHRQSAYHGNEFIMDYLKTQAPFWKKETTNQGDKWIAAKASDMEKSKGW